MSDKDWKLVAAIAGVGGAVVAIHGITSGRWQRWHTVFVVLGAVVAARPYIEEAW